MNNRTMEDRFIKCPQCGHDADNHLSNGCWTSIEDEFLRNWNEEYEPSERTIYEHTDTCDCKLSFEEVVEKAKEIKT